MVPVEIGVGSIRRVKFQTDGNNESLREELEFLKEKHKKAIMRNATYKQRIAHYFNRRVKKRWFKVRDLVLRRVSLNTKEISAEALGLTWEGLYKEAEELRPGIYRLTIMRRSLISRA